MTTTKPTTLQPHISIDLPAELCQSYGIGPTTKLRVIETRVGILIVPMIDAPMDETLRREIGHWQGTAAAKRGFDNRSAVHQVEMRPGDVFWVNMGDGDRSRRPAIIFQDSANCKSLPTALVVPLTTERDAL